MEIDGRVAMIDVGLMFPDEEMLGVDLVLPDFSSILERGEALSCVILTHGHEDHVGAIQYLLRDGDGIGDLAVGATFDDDGGTDRGAVWIVFLNADGTVNSHQKISDTQGNFTGILVDHYGFGGPMSSLGDLDGDGVCDLAVGYPNDDDGGSRRGAVWILFLNPDGTVKSHQKISDTEGGFTGTLDSGERYDRMLWMVS